MQGGCKVAQTHKDHGVPEYSMEVEKSVRKSYRHDMHVTCATSQHINSDVSCAEGVVVLGLVNLALKPACECVLRVQLYSYAIMVPCILCIAE